MRERKRGCCFLIVTAAACGKKGIERSLPLRFLYCVFLSYSDIVYSLWAVVVFPSIGGFPRYTLCLHIIFVFLCLFRAYILHSVVAEHTSGTNLYRDWISSDHSNHQRCAPETDTLSLPPSTAKNGWKQKHYGTTPRHRWRNFYTNIYGVGTTIRSNS